MVKRIGTARRKTRNILRKSPKNRGKLSLTKYFATFEDGQKVVLKAEPSVIKGMYFPRFHGKIGVIDGMKGKCYNVKIKDGNKPKVVTVHPVHLKLA